MTKEDGEKKRGGLKFLAGCTQEVGGGGVIQMRTVCNRGGGGVNNSCNTHMLGVSVSYHGSPIANHV